MREREGFETYRLAELLRGAAQAKSHVMAEASTLAKAPETQERELSGVCNCDCAGCDQEHHCYKVDRGCEL